MNGQRLAGWMGKWVVLLWATRVFMTPEGARDFLNGLPAARALEAKVTCYAAMCVVYYREDQ